LWIEELRLAEQLPASYKATVADYVAPLAARVCTLREHLGRPIVVGINGAPGSGKSTLTLFLVECLQRESGLTAASLSIDDIYLGKQTRQELAENEHPLLQTRGVPGTHDVALGKELLQALTEQSEERVVRLPAFDKATDDRLQQSDWRSIEAPVDVVLFEGWCVGARPQRDADLRDPVNALEAQDDTDGRWRSFVNKNLKEDYAELFSTLDALVMLRIPSFDKVFEWREVQEQKLLGDSGMNAAEIRHFMMYFERLTRHMLARMPDYANTIIELNDAHGMSGMVNKNWPGAPESS
jgi:D-glycerate 3-kinase